LPPPQFPFSLRSKENCGGGGGDGGVATATPFFENEVRKREFYKFAFVSNLMFFDKRKFWLNGQIRVVKVWYNIDKFSIRKAFLK